MHHKYQMNGYNIVLDVNSGSIHAVDDVAYELLDYYKSNTLDEILGIMDGRFDADVIREAYCDISALEKNGQLFSDDIAAAPPVREPVIKALCLLVAHDCNLTCAYCFAEEGEYHSRGKRGLMSFEVGKAAVDFLVEHSGKRRNLEIDFFGGEPLMNLPVIKQIVSYARSVEKQRGKSFRFTITTNGVLLDDEAIKYINENMHNVVLSIDGRRKVNDGMRRFKGGCGSPYDLILPKFKKMAECRTSYYVRGTFTRHNMDFSNDVLHLAGLGFKNVSIEPVVGEESADYTFKEQDLETICKEYEALAVKLLEREQDFNFFHFMLDLTGGPCVAKRLAGCGAGSEYLAVTADGDTYPCHQFAGIDAFKVGTVFGAPSPTVRTKFEGCNVYTKKACSDCWAKFYCSGGCASNAYSANGDIFKPYEIGCHLQRKRTECAIMLKVAQAQLESF